LSGWDELAVRAVDASAVLAIVDPFLPAVQTNIADFLQRFPTMGVVAYGDFSSRPAADVLPLVQAGVTAVVTLNRDDEPAALARVFLCCPSNCWAKPLFDALLLRHGGQVTQLLEQFFDAAMERLSPTDLARRCGMNRRTLERLLKAHGLPPPAALFTWFRLLHAVRLLQDPARTIETVAFALGFGSGSALSNTFKRYTDLSLGNTVRLGGAEHLSSILIRKLGGNGQRPLTPESQDD
jgi:AraC-like DNA-binding protein